MNTQTENPWGPSRHRGNILTTRVLLAGLLASFGSIAWSQDDAEGEETFELSPFEVQTTTFGYEARNTLSGSRINANLRDIPNSVSVLSPEFIEDVAATTPEDAYLYSLNVENTREYTDIANPNAFTGVNFNDFGGRVRGIGFAGRNRDFFRTVFQEDMYALERITISSGPNAVIYNLGGTAGIINTSYKQAMTERNMYKLGLRVDSEGSRRAVVDINAVGLDNKLALRIVALEERAETFRDYSDSDQSRQLFTATYRPFKSTKIRAYYENISIDKLLPRNVVAYDGGITSYLANVAAGASPTIDNRTKQIPSDWQGLLERYGNNQHHWVYDDDTSFYYGRPGGSPDRWVFQTIAPNRSSTYPSDNWPYSLPMELHPESYNLHGETGGREQYGDIAGIIINQTFGDNLAIEIGYNEEKGWTDFFDIAWPSAALLKVDVNQYLPDLVTPNPYAGMYYVESNAQNTRELNTMHEFRASISYNLDLTGISKWLGQHQLVGLLTDERQDRYWGWMRMRTVLPNEVDTYLYDARANFAAGQTIFRHYVDPQNGVAMEVPFDMLDGGGLQPDGSYLYTLRNAPAFGNTWNTLDRYDSFMTAVQSYWLDNKLITTVGYRETDFQNGQARDGLTVRTNQPTYAYGTPRIKDIDHSLDSWGDTTKGDALNYGAVFHITDPSSKFGGWSIYYNWADIFNNQPSNYYGTGERIAPSVGEGYDYGIMFSGFDNKLSFRLNFYKTTTGNTTTCAWCPGIRNQLANIEYKIGGSNDPNGGGYYGLFIDGELPAGHPQFQDNFDFSIPFGSYFMTADREAEGIEFEAYYRPTQNWDFRFTAAENKATDTNAGKGWNEWAVASYDYWKAWAAWEQSTINPVTGNLYSADATSVTTRFSNFMPNYVVTEASNGLRVDQNAGWRINMTAKYTFTEGRFNKMHLGAHIRYREAPVIGYIQTPGDNAFDDFPGLNPNAAFYAPDIDQPVAVEDVFYVDFFMGYHGKLTNKVRYNVRLNIRNLLNDDGMNPQRSDGLGTVRVYNYKEPRLFILSLDLEY